MDNNESKIKKCFLDTDIYRRCADNCKVNLTSNPWMRSKLDEICIANKKLSTFVDGENAFTVAISAFLQAQPIIIETFINSSDSNLDLARYFFGICEPEDISEIVESLSDESIYKILDSDYRNYLEVRKMFGRSPEAINYFAMKSSRYWALVSPGRICRLIVFLIRTKQRFNLASQFLLILPPEVISEITHYTNLSEDDERNLYLSLEDNIYNLPLISPKIYDHMLRLFQDNMEIYFILETMQELVKRRLKIDEITRSFVRYHKRVGMKFTIQWIYSELFGLEYELVVEVLGQLKEKEYITVSEKSTLQALLKTGNMDFMKDLKQEILSI
ncbi:MAG: hypothetical protein H7A25_03725 [Leptospiraceae bacterium]|nr:hypothetical protein [Leptospiraceae bacterium]